MNIENKQVERVALVTGGARRIGAVIAQHLHSAGFAVVIHCRTSTHEANLLAQRLNNLRPNSAKVLIADLCKFELVQQLIQDSFNWYKRLDILINNASVFIRDPDGWDEMFATNVRAPYWLSLEIQQYLAQHQGCIINITDIHAEKTLKGYTIYCQTKAALTMQTKALAVNFAPNIRVNAVAPGAIMWPEEGNALTAELQQKIINKTLLKRHGQPQYIAQAVLALIENEFITGQVLPVEGGRYL